MKKLFIFCTMLCSIVATAQTLDGYDGGSELHNAIKKVREGKQITKPKPVKKKTVEVTKIYAPQRTPYETAYYEAYGTDCPSYLKKLMESEYWEVQKKDAIRAEKESNKLYAEQAEQRKLDSLEKLRVESETQSRLNEQIARLYQKQDSINTAREKSRKDYIDKMRKDTENDKPVFSKLFKKKA